MIVITNDNNTDYRACIIQQYMEKCLFFLYCGTSTEQLFSPIPCFSDAVEKLHSDRTSGNSERDNFNHHWCWDAANKPMHWQTVLLWWMNLMKWHAHQIPCKNPGEEEGSLLASGVNSACLVQTYSLLMHHFCTLASQHCMDRQHKGPFKCYIMFFSGKLTKPPPNANEVGQYTFIMLFVWKFGTPHCIT